MFGLLPFPLGGGIDSGPVPPAPPFALPDVDLLAILDGRHTSLEQFVWLSLFSDARAHPDDVIPAGAERRGWWADIFDGDAFGSRLWLLDRSVVTQETVLRARDYANEALAWLVADGVAAAVDVVTSRMVSDNGAAGIALQVTVTRGDQTPAQVYKFANIWSVING